MEMETAYVHLRVKDNILIGTYKKNVHIDLTVAKEIVRIRLSFTRGKKMPSLILSEGVVSIDKAAREYFVSAPATEGLLATAIVVKTPFSRFLGSVFMHLNKSPMPVRIFSTQAKAETWLQQFIQ